ncbi:LGFP repeat-containing protein [Nonomuraea mangrovi]|uniref:LGFP repeat-containing protein n=1 Tax=Nonomuraea mangrovi TaxID=2316207 RepID=A0ABW4TEL5_9ACTN
MRRAITLGMVAALAVAGAATPAQARTSSCAIQPYGLIGEYWQTMGGEGGVFGCPASTEKGIANSNARRQTFANGQIAWSPDQGGRMIVAAYGKDGRAYVRWGPSNPFNYDYFEILVRSTHIANGTYTRRDGLRVRGAASFHGPGGHFTFRVRGCDDKPLGDVCRQGWTVSVSADA